MGVEESPSNPIPSQASLPHPQYNPNSCNWRWQIRRLTWEMLETPGQVGFHRPRGANKGDNQKCVAFHCSGSFELVEHILSSRITKELPNPSRHRDAILVNCATIARQCKINFTRTLNAITVSMCNVHRIQPAEQRLVVPLQVVFNKYVVEPPRL